MNTEKSRIKQEILEALGHIEGEEGLYLNNLMVVHEEEDRNPVTGSQDEVLDSLQELISAGEVETVEGERGVIFTLSSSS